MPSPSEFTLNGVDVGQLHVSMTPAEPTMYIYHSGDGRYSFRDMHAQMRFALTRTTPFNRGAWQTLNVSQSAQHDTHELRNVQVVYGVSADASDLALDIQPDLPWAEDHFQERVGGKPLNPAPSYRWWPHHKGNADRHVEDEVFSHTYPERFWPRYAGEDAENPYLKHSSGLRGIRYNYGDLDGVLRQLLANPYTRQAVLPVWFPEDTGATDRRVPCSLFYHFQNDGRDSLDCWYSMRSCDFARHFHNDVFMAARLMQWVCTEVFERSDGAVHMIPGRLNLSISNLHLFRGDA